MSFIMRKSSRRKLFLFGRYSLALLPPKKWLSDLGVKAGDEAIVEFDKTKKRLIVSFSHQFNEDLTNNKKIDQPDDWQPIPKL